MELDTPDSSNVNQFTGLQLLRIKRRRGEAPAEQLFVQGGSSSSKRARLGSDHASQPVDHVANQLSKGLSLEQQASQSEAYADMTDVDADQQQADTAGSQTIIQRYVRVQTLDKDAFKGLSADEARGLLHTWQQLAAQQNTATPQSATAASAGAILPSVHYTVVRSKRPRIGIPNAAQHDSIEEQTQAPAAGSDVLENLCNVIDIHAHGNTANGGPASKRVKSAGQPAGTGPSTQSAPQPQQVDHQPEPSSEVEAALKSVFMPMLEDYLSQMGNGITSVLDARPPPQHDSVSDVTKASSHHYKLPSRRPKMTSSITQPPSVHASEPQQQKQNPIAQSSHPHTNEQSTAVETHPTAQGSDGTERKDEDAMDSEDESEQFIYDVYIPVGEAPMELGASNPTNMPIIELPDSDDEMYWVVQEQPGSSKPFNRLGHDSEDSNAESYFANSYPDEEDAEEEDEFDMGEYSGRRKASRQAWGEEEFDVNDYDSSQDEDDGLEPVARSRKIAQTLLHNAMSKHKEALQ